MPDRNASSPVKKDGWLNSLSDGLAKRFPGLARRVQASRSSLSFVVVSVMVLLALLPVILITTGTYFRSRSFILEQTSQQLENLVKSESTQLRDIARYNQQYLDNLSQDEIIQNGLDHLLEDSAQTANQTKAVAFLQSFIQSNPRSRENNVDAVLVLNGQGIVAAASRPEWNDLDLSGETVFQLLSTGKKTYSISSPSSLYSNQWVSLSSQPWVDKTGSQQATLIIATFPQSPKAILETTSAIFDGGKAYFVAFDDSLIGIHKRTGQVVQLPTSSSHSENIQKIFQSPSRQGSGLFDDPNLVPVFTYATWLPEMNLGFIVEVPQTTVFRQIDTLVPFTLTLLAISLLFILILVFFGSRALVNPITQLTHSARNFAKGDWSERSTIQRRDEIGVLAATFNQMVEQISDLYRSLEQKVEERARQLRTASEVGQLATSASNRDEIIERAVKLVIDRFGYTFASIFLIDQSGTSAVLQAAYSQSGEIKGQKGYRINLNSETLIGWVAKNNQARVIPDLTDNQFSASNILLTSSKSEVALPIAVGSQMLGVFEVQNVQVKGFEPESIYVLQTLSNQIANGLQNLRLLEATQVNLEETNLLYRTSRQISLTKDEPQMFQTMREALSQTPYVSGIFSVEEDYLSIVSITDPRNPNEASSIQGITLPLNRIASSLGHSQMVIVDDLSHATDYDVILAFFTRRGCHSAAIFPLSDPTGLSKIIVLGTRDTSPISQAAIQPFLSLVEVINTTRQRFQILSSLQERVNILQTLNRIGEAISAETNLEVLYKTLHAQVSQTFGMDISFLIALYNSKEDLIDIPYVYEGDQLISIPSFPLGEGLTSYVIRTRQPLMIVKDTERRIKELNAKIVGQPAKSWLGVPLLLGNQPIGAMIIQDTVHEERFTPSDLNLFVTLAPQVAVTVRNLQLLDEMQKALRNYDQERFLLNTLMDNTPDQVFFKDLNGHYIRVSQSYARQFNVDNPLSMIGKDDSELLPQGMAKERAMNDQQLLAAGQPQLGRVELSSASGSEKWKLSSQIPMHDENDEIVGLLGIERDITDLKQAEEQAQRRAEELQIAAEIARETSGTLETSRLLANAVNLIRDRFGFYHASIFLLDRMGEYALLRESTGEVGAQMKERGHQLAVGSQSIVGQVLLRKKEWVVNDVQQESLYYANPLLPETRSELVIPLMVGERILGVVDVQSRQENAFLENEVKILRILADQLAIAVWNSILFGQNQETLAQHRLLHQITIAASAANSVDEALQTTVQALHTSTGEERVMLMLVEQGILRVRVFAGYEGMDISKYALNPGEEIPGQAALLRQPVLINDLPNHPEFTAVDPRIQSELAVPIFFSERLLGVLDLASTQAGTYDEADQEILSSLGNTLGAIIANTQLVGEVRQQVERQRMLYDITSRIRRTTDVQTILETSAREIARSIGAKSAHIELNETKAALPVKDQKTAGGNGNGNGAKSRKETDR